MEEVPAGVLARLQAKADAQASWDLKRQEWADERRLATLHGHGRVWGIPAEKWRPILAEQAKRRAGKDALVAQLVAELAREWLAGVNSMALV